MICSDASQQLSAYLDQELSPADRVALEGHLGSCGACSEALASLRSVTRELGALPAIEASSDFRRRVLGEIEAQGQKEGSGPALHAPARQPAARRFRTRLATLGALGTLGAAAAAFLAIARGPTHAGNPGSASDLAIAGELELFENYPSVQLVDSIDGPEDLAVVADLDRLGSGEGPR
jgi:anti-sigma factor RsiW